MCPVVTKYIVTPIVYVIVTNCVVIRNQMDLSVNISIIRNSNSIEFLSNGI